MAGADCFRDLLVDLPDTLEELRSPDLGAIAEFYDLLGGDDFRAFLAEVTEAFETGSHPGTFWAKWVEAVVERMTAPETAGPRGRE